MGKVNVYLPDSLAQEAKDAGISISAIAQTAVRDVLSSIAAIRSGGDVPSGGVGRLTPRLAAIVDGLPRPASAADLFGAIVLAGDNLGARVLRDLGIELPPPAPRRKRPAGTKAGVEGEAADVLVAAVHVALDLRHSFVGTEHVVIAMAEDGSPVSFLFDALGISAATVRARVERLLTNPWRTDAPGPGAPDPAAMARIQRQLRDITEELDRLRRSS